MRRIGSLMICFVLVAGCVSEKTVVKQAATGGNDKASLILPELSKGKWAISVKGYSGSEKYQDCLDRNELISKRLDELGCQVVDMRQLNGTYTYVAQCKQLVSVENKAGRVTWTVSGGSSEFKLVSEMLGDKSGMRTDMHAKRIGDCRPPRVQRLQCEETSSVRCSDCQTVSVNILGMTYKQEFCFSGPHSLFGPACEQHDYCYRHGWATYGLSREECDHRFKRDMKRVCSRKDWAIQKVGDKLCEAAATSFYHGVRAWGEDSYLKEGASSCCIFQQDGEDLTACGQCQEGGKTCGDTGGGSGQTGGSGHTGGSGQTLGRCCEMDYETGKCLLYVKPPHLCP